MPALALQGLSKAFGDELAVEPTDLEFKQGELTALLGPSGCGKTTLLRIIAGLTAPTTGRVLLDGKDISSQPAQVRRFGMVFQSFALFSHLSVLENVAYSLRIHGVPKQERNERAAELLSLVQMPDYGQRRIKELSGGQRQRVAIARALAQSPDVFLLDEPMSALDAKLREEMQIELRLLQQRLGITTIVVTHDQREAMTMADNIVVMKKGRVEQVGTPQDIYSNPASTFVATFIGKANLLKGHVQNGAVSVGGQMLHASSDLQFLNGSEVVLFTRPENCRLSYTAGENSIEGSIKYVSYVGSTLEIHLQTHIGTLLLEVPNTQHGHKLLVGDQVYIQLPHDGFKIFPANAA